MDKEIKEILAYLKDNSKSFIICGSSYYKISDYKAKVLLKYITNLQEENKRLKEWKEDLLNENIELENIRKEAIEYIHNNQPVFELSSKEQIQKWFEKEYYIELLNILKGDDKDD